MLKSTVIHLFMLATHVPVQYMLSAIIASPVSFMVAATALENGTRYMYIDDDLYCLTQMPVDDLLKIQKTIGMLHAVSDYDKKRMLLAPATASKIDNQTDTSGSNIDSAVRELSEADETKNIFHFFRPNTTPTPTPLTPTAASFLWKFPWSASHANDMMANDMMMQKKHGLFKHKFGHASGWEEEKPSKIEKVLHFSITALSFIAFAGYLLCMIVQAIKSKGTTFYHSGLLPIKALVSQAALNRVQLLRPNRYRRQIKVADRIVVAEPDPDSLYNALLLVAKGYVQLNKLIQSPV